MNRLIPLALSVLTSCGPQTKEACIQETNTELAPHVHPDDLGVLSGALCTQTKIALDLNHDGTSSEICGEKGAQDEQCDLPSKVELSSCQQAYYEKVEHSLNKVDATWLAQIVCDNENGIGMAPKPTIRIDADLDGYSTATARYDDAPADCNDSNPKVHNHAQEICDGLDNNCNGYVDIDGFRTNGGVFWYNDEDGDGYGKIEENSPSVYVCDGQEAPRGKTKDPHPDCDDNDPQKNVMPEIANDGKDNDCDGLIDEQFPSLPSFAAEPRADASYEIHEKPHRLVVNRPLQKSWDQLMTETMTLMSPQGEYEYQDDYLTNSFRSFRDESISPAALSLLYPMTELYPAFKQAPHEICDWAIPIAGARFSSMIPAARVGTKEMIDHAQAYLALYPMQEGKEDSYLATLQGNTCQNTFGREGDCENYFIEYRPGSKWKRSQANIAAFRADYEQWVAKKSTEELRTFSDLPPDRYRGLEAFLYRRIKDGVNPNDLLYCANGFEAQIRSNH